MFGPGPSPIFTANPAHYYPSQQSCDMMSREKTTGSLNLDAKRRDSRSFPSKHPQHHVPAVRRPHRELFIEQTKEITMAEAFMEIQVPNQKSYDGIQFPSVLSPSPRTSLISLSLFTEAIKREKRFLDSLLHKSGAVLFRGFPVETASDFNDVVEAFGFEELPYVGGAAPRTNIVGRVFTANESPADQKIPFHHEMAQVYSVNSYNFFG